MTENRWKFNFPFLPGVPKGEGMLPLGWLGVVGIGLQGKFEEIRVGPKAFLRLKIG